MTIEARRYLRRLTAWLLLVGWGVSWAAVATVQPDLIALPWAQVSVGMLIASWGGFTATLGRKLAAHYESRPFHLKVEILRDGAVSVTVGSGGYLLGAWYALDAMILGVVLLLSGYLGVKILSEASERLLSILSSKIK